MKAIATFSVLALALFAGVDAVHFCYEEGVECSPNHWPDACHNGKHQSPIDIPSGKRSAHYTFEFNKEYKDEATVVAVNNGHTVQFSVNNQTTSNAIVTIKIDDVSTEYVFAQLHCHWESEHRLNNETFDVECHLVHYRKDIGSVTNAVAKNDTTGLLVIGVFYRAEEGKENKAFKPLTDSIKKVTTTDAKNFQPCENTVSLHSLLPLSGKNHWTGDDVFDVATYNGSLTTPGCSEIVRWMVFTKPVIISTEQLEKFSQLKDDKGEELKNNFRPLQPLNGRTVTHATVTEKVSDGELEVFPKRIEELYEFIMNLFKPSNK
jgi:carbonic anhydrase